MPNPAPAWWRSGVIYQIYPRSFQDSNGDGIGDLHGIASRLDYLAWLGIDAIWISPIYPSPMADFGYDISDYRDIQPIFGALRDFDDLVARAHELGIKVLLDYVPNHTSWQHPWFAESCASRESPKREFYVWRDGRPDGGPPNNWVSHFGGSAWELDEATGQYYLHSFLKEQPDLNWRHPQVRKEMLDVLRFWCDRGVDGFRVDVLYQVIKDDEFRDDPPNGEWVVADGPYNRLRHVYSMDRPEVHEVVAEMRAVLDSYEDRVMIAEVWLPLDRLVAYYGCDGHGAQLPLNFQLVQLPWDADSIRDAIRAYELSLPSGCWPNWVLGNHDVHRIASRIGSAQARVAAMLLLLLRGTPTLYYGDEIGMTDAPIPADRVQDPLEKRVPGLGLGRDPERSPMRWDASPDAGFTSGESWLPLGDGYPNRNVESSRSDPSSLLSFYRRLLEMRRLEPALSVGSYRELDGSPGALAWIREHEGRRFLVAVNLTHQSAVVDLEGLVGTIVLATDPGSLGERLEGRLTLSGDQGLIARLE